MQTRQHPIETIPDFTPVQPVDPPARYLGGKRLLAKTLINKIKAIPHYTYVEPFMGMGGVFLRRPFRAKLEVVNDRSNEIANLFWILQRHPKAFMDVLKWQMPVRSEFERLSKTDPSTLTDLERAARFLYLQSLAFGGKLKSRTFGVCADQQSRFNYIKIENRINALHQRLCPVVIENLPYQGIITRYDSHRTLFYIDPPYYGNEHDYGLIFERTDFETLATLLANIKGKFILSLNDRPEVRQIFERFTIEAVTTTYSVNPTASKKVGEVIISNSPVVLQ